MTFGDKAKNKTDKIKGKAKEAAGAATGNTRMQTEGKIDQTKADMKTTGQKVSDAVRRVLGK